MLKANDILLVIEARFLIVCPLQLEKSIAKTHQCFYLKIIIIITYNIKVFYIG